MKDVRDRRSPGWFGQYADEIFVRFFSPFGLDGCHILFQFFCRRCVELVQDARVYVQPRIRGNELFLFVCPLIVRRFEGLTENFPLVFGKFF